MAEKKTHMVAIRMDVALKDKIDAGVEETGRSVSGEIQWRLEDYDRISRAYDLLSSDPRLQALFRELAVVRDHVAGLAEAKKWEDSDKAEWTAYLQLAVHFLRYRFDQTVASGDAPTEHPRIGPDEYVSVLHIIDPTPMKLVTMYRERVLATPEEAQVICQSLLTGLPQLARDLVKSGADRSFAKAEAAKLKTEILDRFPRLADDT